MSTKRRFSKYRLLRKHYRFMQMLGEQTKVTSVVAGKRRRPFCTGCGKKIRNVKKLVYRDGRPYHKSCLEKVSKNETPERGNSDAGVGKAARGKQREEVHNVQTLATNKRNKRKMPENEGALHEHEQGLSVLGEERSREGE